MLNKLWEKASSGLGWPEHMEQKIVLEHLLNQISKPGGSQD